MHTAGKLLYAGVTGLRIEARRQLSKLQRCQVRLDRISSDLRPPSRRLAVREASPDRDGADREQPEHAVPSQLARTNWYRTMLVNAGPAEPASRTKLRAPERGGVQRKHDLK